MTWTFNRGPGASVEVELRLVSLGCVVLSRGLLDETEVVGSGGGG